MKGRYIVSALSGAPVFDGFSDRIDAVISRMIRQAARHAPESLSERLIEEWLAHLVEKRGWFGRLRFALDCYWAAVVIKWDGCTLSPSTSRLTAGGTTAGVVFHGPPLWSRRAGSAAASTVMCEINTTPLIDVMLVLLVTLIISLPLMTHAVKLELPQGSSVSGNARPEVIDLEIDFDGTVAWNGTALAGLQQLERYLQAEAQRDPQPEIHVRADRRAKYAAVIEVLAAAQRNRLHRVGLVDTTAFKDQW